MLSQALIEAIRPQQRIAIFIWVAMVVSVILYGGTLLLLDRNDTLNRIVTDRPEPPAIVSALKTWSPLILLVLGGVSLAAGSLLLSRARLQKVLGKSAMAQQVVRLPVGAAADDQRTPLDRLDPEELRFYALVPRYIQALTIRLAAAEAVAVYGFVTALLGAEPSFFYPLAGIALLLMVVAFPRLPRFIDRQQDLLRPMGCQGMG